METPERARLECGTIIEFPYGVLAVTKWRIIREFGDGQQILAELECIECPDVRGIGVKKVLPMKQLVGGSYIPWR